MVWSPQKYGPTRLLSQPAQHLGQGIAAVIGWITRAIRRLAFWTAVGLPFCYLPVLVDGLTRPEGLVLVGLFVVNVVALVAGHDYAREPTS